ncbi:MAG TPA: hypothetical protein DCL54_18570 [Alphaproteobacteria bacterium]|nr:hypothetical protein [Alphaproteobacteria bacterium]HAJ48587.1 hypothetical protein [Alphaproteobacteria bacterium]
MTPSLIADGLLALLLLAMLAAVLRLEWRLKSFRAGQTAMADLIRELTVASMRAEASISGLKNTAQESGAALDQQIKRARALTDEMALLSDRGTQMVQGPRRPQSDPAATALRALGGAR